MTFSQRKDIYAERDNVWTFTYQKSSPN